MPRKNAMDAEETIDLEEEEEENNSRNSVSSENEEASGSSDSDVFEEVDTVIFTLQPLLEASLDAIRESAGQYLKPCVAPKPCLMLEVYGLSFSLRQVCSLANRHKATTLCSVTGGASSKLILGRIWLLTYSCAE